MLNALPSTVIMRWVLANYFFSFFAVRRTSGSSFAHSVLNDVDIWCDSVLPDSETSSKARVHGLLFEFAAVLMAYVRAIPCRHDCQHVIYATH